MFRSTTLFACLFLVLVTPSFINAAPAEKTSLSKLKGATILIVISLSAGEKQKNEGRGLAESAESMLAQEFSKRGMAALTSQELPPRIREAAGLPDLAQLTEHAKKSGITGLILGSLVAERSEIRPVGVSMTKTSAELRAKLYDRDGRVQKVYHLMERASAPERMQADNDVLQSLAAQVTEQTDDTTLTALSRIAPQTVVVAQSSNSNDDLAVIPVFDSKPLDNDLALVVGIETYRSLPSAEYSARDAELVRDHLLALGFQKRNIEYLINERATKSDIERALQGWIPNRLKGGAKVLVYFSGHGAPEPQSGDAYLVPYDGDPNYLAFTGIPLRRLYDSLGKLETRQVMVVLDSCFSGSGGRSVLAKGARALVMTKDQATLPSSVAVLTATGQGQISTSSPERQNGLLTYHFLQAIRNGKRKLMDIHTYVRSRVEDEAKSQNVIQTPSLMTGAGRKSDEYQLGN